jgi:OmpA-OmpF porin, OOP family
MKSFQKHKIFDILQISTNLVQNMVCKFMRKASHNKLFTLLFIVALILPQSLMAQRWKMLRYEVGAGVGATQIFGDIGGTADEKNLFGLKDISFNESRLAYGAHARYKLNTQFSIKANLNGGFAKGSDAGSRNDRGRSYKATFFEFSGQFEYYLLTEEPKQRSSAMYSKKGMLNNYSSLSLYGFLGIGVNYSMLKHNYSSILPVDSYKSSNVAPVIPLGIGVKYVIDERWFIGAELGYRWTFSDYIDGYKQIESSKHNDVYYFLLFTANYRIKTTKRNIPAFIDKKYRKYSL